MDEIVFKILIVFFVLPSISISSGYCYKSCGYNKQRLSEYEKKIAAKRVKVFKENFTLLYYINYLNLTLLFIGIIFLFFSTNNYIDSFFSEKGLIYISIAFLIILSILSIKTIEYYKKTPLETKNFFYDLRKSLFIMVILASFAYSIVFIVFSNKYLDFFESEKKVVTITYTDFERPKNGLNDYYVRFKPSIEQIDKLYVSYFFYKKCNSSDNMILHVHKGLFGFRYIQY